MTALHEAEVRARFDILQGRFKRGVARDDFRLRALLDCVGPVAGRRVLDLGCGKGRFARPLADAGAEVIGLDLSPAMLSQADGLNRVHASARRLPFPDCCFDVVFAVEVFEHLAEPGEVIAEARRVLRPGGVFAVVDKNARSLNDRRPWLPNLLLKWLDERRGRWMYPSGGPVRERWFRPPGLARRLRPSFIDVRVEFLLSPSESRSWVFRAVPATRLFALWSGRVPVARSA